MKKKNILLFGSTGSIGTCVINLLRNNKDYNLHGITCNENLEKLLKIKDEFNPINVGIGIYNDNIDYNKIENTNLFFGLNEFQDMITEDIDIVILAISGIECFELALKIAESGKIIGLANKECIISLGAIFTEKCIKNKSTIIPLDSEHNSIYQILKGNNSGIKKLIITASGGPFLNYDLKKFSQITPEQAIAHPKWNMGKKISIDSANMMNKSLEMIEAKYLFDINFSNIGALIHPQVLVHGIVTYNDSSMISFLSYPNMEIPISNLLYPKKNKYLNKYKIDLVKDGPLEFFNIDNDRFPAISLCKKVMNFGGLAPHAFNYINDKMNQLFLQKRIGFLDIVKFNEILIDRLFKNDSNIEYPSIQDINDLNIIINDNIKKLLTI